MVNRRLGSEEEYRHSLFKNWLKGDRLGAEDMREILWTENYSVVQRRLAFRLNIDLCRSRSTNEGGMTESDTNETEDCVGDTDPEELEDRLSEEADDNSEPQPSSGTGGFELDSQLHDFIAWGFDAALEEVDCKVSDGTIYCTCVTDKYGNQSKVGLLTERTIGARKAFEWRTMAGFGAFVKGVWVNRSHDRFRRITGYSPKDMLLRKYNLPDPMALIETICKSKDPLGQFLRNEIGPSQLLDWLVQEDNSAVKSFLGELNKIISVKLIEPAEDPFELRTKRLLRRHNIQRLVEVFPKLIEFSDVPTGKAKNDDLDSNGLSSRQNPESELEPKQELLYQYKQLLGLSFNQDATLTTSHIPDPAALIRTLLSEKPLWLFPARKEGQVGKKGQERLKRLQNNSVSAEQLVAMLNNVICEESIWSEESFPHLNLSELGEHFAGREGITLGAHNIQLLQKAYPSLIVSQDAMSLDPGSDGGEADQQAWPVETRWNKDSDEAQRGATKKRLYYLLRLYLRQAIWNASLQRTVWGCQSGHKMNADQFDELEQMLEVPIVSLLAEAQVSAISLDQKEARDFLVQCTALLLNESDLKNVRDTYVYQPISRVRGLLKLVTPWMVS